MADTTSTLYGPPSGGFYTAGDQVTDAGSYVWRCVKTGFASSEPTDWSSSGVAVFALVGMSDSPAGAKTGSTVTMHDVQGGLIHKTTLTFTDTPVTITNGASEWTGTLVYTYPTKKILLLGAHAVMNLTTTSVIATSTNGATATVAFGSVTDDGTHTGTKADHSADTNFDTSATINVAAADATMELAAAATTWFAATPSKIYLNIKCATGSIDATLLVNGYYTFTWMADR